MKIRNALTRLKYAIQNPLKNGKQKMVLGVAQIETWLRYVTMRCDKISFALILKHLQWFSRIGVRDMASLIKIDAQQWQQSSSSAANRVSFAIQYVCDPHLRWLEFRADKFNWWIILFADINRKFNCSQTRQQCWENTKLQLVHMWARASIYAFAKANVCRKWQRTKASTTPIPLTVE